MTSRKKGGYGKSGNFVHPLTRKAIMARDAPDGLPEHALCVFCGERAFGLDHVKPESLGGSHAPTNLVASCRFCNTSKHDRPLKDFLARRFPGDVEAQEAAARRVRNATRRNIGRLRDRIKLQEAALRAFRLAPRKGPHERVSIRSQLSYDDLVVALSPLFDQLRLPTAPPAPVEYAYDGDEDVPF